MSRRNKSVGIDHADGIRQRIREVAGGLSANALANRLGYHQPTVSRWLKNRMPAHKFVWDCAGEFGVSFEWLWEGKGPKYAKQMGKTSVQVAEEAALYQEVRRAGNWARELIEEINRDKGLREAAEGLLSLKKSDEEGFSLVKSLIDRWAKRS